jgi:hypothetical protein
MLVYFFKAKQFIQMLANVGALAYVVVTGGIFFLLVVNSAD